MTTDTLTLSAFLLARIAEDDMGARRAFCEFRYPATESEDLDAFFRRHEPANALTTAERMRSAVETLTERLDHYERILQRDFPGQFDDFDDVEYSMLCETTATIDHALRNLAVIYAQHPDYREDWRPW